MGLNSPFRYHIVKRYLFNTTLPKAFSFFEDFFSKVQISNIIGVLNYFEKNHYSGKAFPIIKYNLDA